MPPMGLKARSATPPTYDTALAERIRRVFGPRPDVIEKRMFGGLCFMVGGHMCCGLAKGGFMVRVGPEAYEAALADKGARPMDFTGRPLRGMVYVDSGECSSLSTLRKWVNRGLNFVETLPARPPR